MTNNDERLDVIVVGAHPDDGEIACGGTIAALVEQGYRVGIIDLTDGEPTPLSPSPDVRREEAMAAAKILGVHVRKILDFTNRRLMDARDDERRCRGHAELLSFGLVRTDPRQITPTMLRLMATSAPRRIPSPIAISPIPAG